VAKTSVSARNDAAGWYTGWFLFGSHCTGILLAQGSGFEPSLGFECCRGSVIFFAHECVCHWVMRSRRGIALFPGEKELNTGLAASTTVLGFMGEAPPRRWDAVRDYCLEEAQPPEADHPSARRVEAEMSRYRAPVRFGSLSWGAEGGLISTGGSSLAFMHVSWKLERSNCSADGMELKTHCRVSNVTASVSAAYDEAH